MADLNDIINTLIAEAYGEGDEGMRRVGETILNRSAIRGIDPVSVVRQPSQYTGYFAPGPAAVQAQQDPIARAAAEAAWQLAKQPGDPTNGADHYFNPSIVNPGWQNSMVPTGDFGGHSFYRSRQVPADALAALLTPTTRDVAFPRARPTVRDDIEMPRARPQSPGEQMAALFGGSFSAPRDAATASALDQYLARQTAAGGNLTMPGQIDRSVNSIAQDNSLAAALSRTFAPRSVPAMPSGVTQSFAGQERISPSSAQAVARALTPAKSPQTYAAQDGGVRDPFNGDPGTRASGPVVASIPSRGLFGDDPGTPAAGPVVATVGTSNIGKPPTTRVVQSVPVSTAKVSAPKQTTAQIRADNGQNRSATAATAKTTPLTIGATPNFAGQDRAAQKQMDGIGAAPQFGDLAMMFGNTPQASGSVNNKKPTERLPAGGSWTLPEADRLALHGIEPPAQVNIPNSTAQVQLPRRRPDTPQKTQVAITRPRKVAPTPAAAALRPQAGMPSQPTPARAIAPARPAAPPQAVRPSQPSGLNSQQKYDWANAVAAQVARENATRGTTSSLNDRITSGDLWGYGGSSGSQPLVQWTGALPSFDGPATIRR